MALWLVRSRNIKQIFKIKISSIESTHFLFYAKYSNSYKTLAGYRSSNGFGDKLASIFSFRRPESAGAGEQVEAMAYAAADDNQGIEFPGGKVPFTPKMKFISESSEERVPCYRVLDDDGNLIEGTVFEAVDNKTAVKIYKTMVTLEIMDTIFYEAQRQGRIAFYLTSMGEEATSIATAAALSPHDVVLPQYREPGVLLWRGFGLQDIANQLYGTKDAHAKGRTMPVDYGSKQLNVLTVSAPLATQLPQAAGVAYALKMENKEACAVAFMGDGATSEGDFHGALNFAAVMDSPVVFICRNNGWAISTPISDQFRSDGVVVKGRAYGIRSTRVDGNDALAMYSAVRAARDFSIREKKPVLIEALTYRVGHHSTSDDSTKYRPLSEIEHWRRARNPIIKFRKWIERNGWWSNDEETELRGSIRKQILNAIQVADKKERPSLENLFSDVYDQVPSNLQEQAKSLRLTIKRHQQDFPADVPTL